MTKIESADRAYQLHTEVLARTIATAGNLLELGRLFKTIRDEKLYRHLDADTFETYLGFPEIHFGRSTVFSFIRIYELYVIKLGVDQKFLAEIGHGKLQVINTKVEEDPDEWLFKAKELSKSDLRNEVRTAQGKKEIIYEANKDLPDIFDFKDYLSFVKAHPCVVCGQKEVDAHHFPRTAGAGADDTHRIPLCRRCHTEFHQDPFDFLWQHKDKVFGYFYNVFLKCFALIRTLSK